MSHTVSTSPTTTNSSQHIQNSITREAISNKCVVPCSSENRVKKKLEPKVEVEKCENNKAGILQNSGLNSPHKVSLRDKLPHSNLSNTEQRKSVRVEKKKVNHCSKYNELSCGNKVIKTAKVSIKNEKYPTKKKVLVFQLPIGRKSQNKSGLSLINQKTLLEYKKTPQKSSQYLKNKKVFKSLKCARLKLPDHHPKLGKNKKEESPLKNDQLIKKTNDFDSTTNSVCLKKSPSTSGLSIAQVIEQLKGKDSSFDVKLFEWIISRIKTKCTSFSLKFCKQFGAMRELSSFIDSLPIKIQDQWKETLESSKYITPIFASGWEMIFGPSVPPICSLYLAANLSFLHVERRRKRRKAKATIFSNDFPSMHPIKEEFVPVADAPKQLTNSKQESKKTFCECKAFMKYLKALKCIKVLKERLLYYKQKTFSLQRSLIQEKNMIKKWVKYKNNATNCQRKNPRKNVPKGDNNSDLCIDKSLTPRKGQLTVAQLELDSKDSKTQISNPCPLAVDGTPSKIVSIPVTGDSASDQAPSNPGMFGNSTLNNDHTYNKSSNNYLTNLAEVSPVKAPLIPFTDSGYLLISNKLSTEQFVTEKDELHSPKTDFTHAISPTRPKSWSTLSSPLNSSWQGDQQATSSRDKTATNALNSRLSDTPHILFDSNEASSSNMPESNIGKLVSLITNIKKKLKQFTACLFAKSLEPEVAVNLSNALKECELMFQYLERSVSEKFYDLNLYKKEIIALQTDLINNEMVLKTQINEKELLSNRYQDLKKIITLDLVPELQNCSNNVEPAGSDVSTTKPSTEMESNDALNNCLALNLKRTALEIKRLRDEIKMKSEKILHIENENKVVSEKLAAFDEAHAKFKFQNGMHRSLLDSFESDLKLLKEDNERLKQEVNRERELKAISEANYNKSEMMFKESERSWNNSKEALVSQAQMQLEEVNKAKSDLEITKQFIIDIRKVLGFEAAFELSSTKLGEELKIIQMWFSLIKEKTEKNRQMLHPLTMQMSKFKRDKLAYIRGNRLLRKKLKCLQMTMSSLRSELENLKLDKTACPGSAIFGTPSLIEKTHDNCNNSQHMQFDNNSLAKELCLQKQQMDHLVSRNRKLESDCERLVSLLKQERDEASRQLELQLAMFCSTAERYREQIKRIEEGII